MDQVTKKWGYVDTYGGKLAENIVQAISRDLLAFAMQNIDNEAYDIVIHVHDEPGTEVPEELGNQALKRMCEIMAINPDWAIGLPLKAEGFVSKYYKKD